MKNSFKNLHIGLTDLVGNKFNGHDLHLYLRQKGVDSRQLVWSKESNDPYTYIIRDYDKNSEEIRNYFTQIHNQYELDSITNVLGYDIIYSDQFLNADLIHYHLISDHFFDLLLLPLMTRLKPSVITLHDPWLLGGHCVHHFDCNKWQSHCKDCPYLSVHYPLKKDNSALNFSLRKDAIERSEIDVIVASKWMEKKVKLSPVFKNKKVHYIPFGINQNIFYPINKSFAKSFFNLSPDDLVLMFRYHESEFKGLDIIDYVLKNVKSNKKIILFILDNIPEKPKYSFNYESICFGWVKDDELLAKIYSAADILLMPSKMETFGMMAVEAMSCGTLPIVWEGTALQEITNSPHCGVASERNPRAYAKLIQYYIENKKELIKHQEACAKFAKKKFNHENYVKKILDVYKTLMMRKSINKDDELLLNQLKKHMLVKSNNNKNYLYNQQKTNKLKKYLRFVFYKIDKIVPVYIRKKTKQYLSFLIKLIKVI